MLPQEVRDRVRSYIQYQGSKPSEAIIDLIATGQAKLLDAVADVDEARAAKQPAEGEWSLRELMLHVVTAENATTALVSRLSTGDYGDDKREHPDRVLGMQRQDDGTPFRALIDELRTVNERLLDAIRRIPPAPDLSKTPRHPFFGPLNVFEWAAFQRVHDEDHIQHAQKILEAVG